MITSTSNPRVKAARKLSSRKERYASGQLLVEGVRLLSDAWQSGVTPHIVFFEPETVAHNENAAALLHLLEAAGLACLACSPAVFATLTGTVTPQGVAAIIPLPSQPLPHSSTLILILDQLRDPGNAGTLLRSGEAAGVDLVIFGPNTVDPFNDKVVRAGMGAHFRLPLRTAATWAEVASLLPPDLPLYLADAHGQMEYDQVDWRQPSGLVVGGEAAGASVEARRHATTVAIPMRGAVESLNAGTAGSIILFEAARQRRQNR
ncbi:MAG: RNA methyltransferase [Caldilineaceae bacterium]|nr:RNA methyltransferase [Caldilineaceae bacterium]